MADLHRWRPGPDMEPRRARALLSQWERDDHGGGHQTGNAVPIWRTQGIVRGAHPEQQRQHRCEQGWPFSAAGDRRAASRHAHDRRAELARVVAKNALDYVLHRDVPFRQEVAMRRILAGAAGLACVLSPLAFAQTGTPGRQGNAPQGNSGAEACSHSPICAWGRERNIISHEVRTPDLGFAYAYPFALPAGGGGVAAVAINSRGHLFAFQRNAAGKPQLFEFDQNHTLVHAIGDDVIGHQNKAHGMAIDAEDNIWICDENGDTVMKLSPQGKLLMTLGVRGQRGDRDEAKGQRLLWQPLHLAFAPNGDIYIGMGHANESPNDTDKS